MSVEIKIGDCIEILRTMPDESVHCCITSPPYYGLRQYLPSGSGKEKSEIGREQTPKKFVEKIVDVFAEVHRVLRSDGTLWVNLGDSFASAGRNRTKQQATSSSTLQGTLESQCQSLKQINKITDGLKPKDLIGIPWMVAFALRDWGWWLRQDLIYSKPNPMPESVRDRCTKAHEYIFLLAKSERYYFDSVAISEPAIYGDNGSTFDGERDLLIRPNTGKKRRKTVARGEFNGKTNELEGREAFRAIKDTRNKRSVWTVASQPYKGAHFATFPKELIRPCVLAGCPEFCCKKCGLPVERELRKTRIKTRPGNNTKVTGDSMTDGNRDTRRHVTKIETIGFKPSCNCNVELVPGVILDPFGGSGTTAEVAIEEGRNAILIDLNPEYEKLMRERIQRASEKFPLFN